MPRYPAIVTGDDVRLVHPITTDYIAPNISTNATVTCRIVSEDKSINYTPEVVQLSTQDGADWANGIVSVNIASSLTSLITPLVTRWNHGTAPAYVKTKVIDGTQDTHFAKVTIVIGNVA